MQQDVAGVKVLSIGLDVYITALAVASAQKSHRRLLDHLGGRPQAFSWEGPFCGVVNQADQIQLMRHRRELPADCLQREEQSAIRHKRNCRRDDSPYTAFMVCPLGRKGKICSANGKCPISGLSQKRAQASKLPPLVVKLSRVNEFLNQEKLFMPTQVGSFTVFGAIEQKCLA